MTSSRWTSSATIFSAALRRLVPGETESTKRDMTSATMPTGVTAPSPWRTAVSVSLRW
ncbi:hypothetical protein D3C83_313840 [compost metagenome]